MDLKKIKKELKNDNEDGEETVSFIWNIFIPYELEVQFQGEFFYKIYHRFFKDTFLSYIKYKIIDEFKNN